MTSHNAPKLPPLAPRQDAAAEDADLKELLRTVHDLGGEAGGAIQAQDRDQEKWGKSTFVTCECLAWRGVWNNVEKHRRHQELGDTQYLGLPYYGRWLLSATKAMLDKDQVTLAELSSKIQEVKKRHEQKSPNPS